MADLLKFITCGSVDDGKSTLIGHMLYDAKLIFTDQERALELDSKVGSAGGGIDYSLLLDGLILHNDSVTVAVAATVSVSIVFIVMFAKVVGSILPIAAEKVGVDPAVMANPLISTLTDAVSLLIYIYAAKLILHI